jgi:hypothetical protein
MYGAFFFGGEGMNVVTLPVKPAKEVGGRIMYCSTKYIYMQDKQSLKPRLLEKPAGKSVNSCVQLR